MADFRVETIELVRRSTFINDVDLDDPGVKRRPISLVLQGILDGTLGGWGDIHLKDEDLLCVHVISYTEGEQNK